MASQIKTTARIIVAFIAVCLFFHPNTHAQKAALQVPVKVSQAGLPVTMGIPFSEASAVYSTTNLALLDPNGNAIPVQSRVMARWRGAADDPTKPIKWALLDFAPFVKGNYRLTNSGAGISVINPVQASPDANKIQVKTAQLQLVFSRSGNELISSFQLNGTEQLTAPFTLQTAFPHSAVVVSSPTTSDSLLVNSNEFLTVGNQVRFERSVTLRYPHEKGMTALFSLDHQLQGNHRYLLDEGTPQQEEVLAATADNGLLKLQSPLQFNHGAGARLRDLSAELETATIKSINAQTITFTEPLKQKHVTGDIFTVVESVAVATTAKIESAVIEESNALRIVVKQQGHFAFTSAGAAEKIAAPTFNFTLRYYIYHNQPFIRVSVRLMNEGTYGMGSQRLQTGYAQHVLLKNLAAIFPTVSASTGSDSVLRSSEATTRITAQQDFAEIKAGAVSLAVPEFAANYPKALTGKNSGLTFDLFPATNEIYQFDGARAKTTDFYIGANAAKGLEMNHSLRAAVDPAYLARTGAIRPMMVEKRDWNAQFAADPELAEAATRSEKYFSVGYAVETSDATSRLPAQSISEYRLRNEQGNHFGWRNFGDLAWSDGYANVHYDLPFILLREFLRTGDARAFQIGSQMAKYRSDWGQYHSDDYWDRQHEYNMRGLAFYEKGEHGTETMPQPTHNWIEGLWLQWALTGDESVREAALEGSAALTRMVNSQQIINNAIGWNESRWLGWPALGLTVAWRYTGDNQYLDGSRKAIYTLMQAEEAAGKKGWFIPETSGIGPIAQPFMWAGYSQLGVIEYWRETGDNRVAGFIVRVADWLVGNSGSAPVLRGGRNLGGNQYEPIGADFSWSPTKPPTSIVTELAMMNLPTLVAASQITNRADLRSTARQLFRDVVFYRDFQDGSPVDTPSRSVINFRSVLYGGSSPKVYGQTGLTLSEFLPEIAGTTTLPRRAVIVENNPVFDGASTRTARVGQTLHIALKSFDPNGKPMNTAVSGLPENATYNPYTNEIVFTPSAAQAGQLFLIQVGGGNADGKYQGRIDVIVLSEIIQIRLLTPADGDHLLPGTSTMIHWEAESQTTLTKYEIRLSTDGGKTYATLLSEVPATTNEYEWKIPESYKDLKGAALRIMIVAIDANSRTSIAVSARDLMIAGNLAVVSAANYQANFAPGTLGSGFGLSLVVVPPNAEASTSLYQKNGTTAEVIDSAGQYHRVPLLFAGKANGYDQINFYLPEEIATGAATMTVYASNGEVSQSTLNIQPTAPAIFTIDQNGKGDAAVVATSDSINFDLGFAVQDTAKNVYVSLFGTGWRFASQAQGGKILLNGLPSSTRNVIVELDGKPVEVLYAGAQPEYLGLDQINIKLPKDLLAGAYPLTIKFGDQISNQVMLRIK